MIITNLCFLFVGFCNTKTDSNDLTLHHYQDFLVIVVSIRTVLVEIIGRGSMKFAVIGHGHT